MQELKGLGVALVTPFDQKGNIEYLSLRQLLEHTVKGGVDFWVVMGSTGEAITLSEQEQTDVLSFVQKNNPKKLPIVLGMGGSDTASIIDRINSIDLTGVTAILSSSPAYNKPTQKGIIAHFEKIANSSPKPIMLYNVPGRTASNMEAASTIKLSKHPNIIGIKEASGNIPQVMKVIQGCANGFIITSGDDMLTPALISVGAQGLISVLANALPKEFKIMIDSALTGDFNASRHQAFKIMELSELMYVEGNPTGVKELLSQLSICSNQVRLPLVAATSDLSNKIAQLL